MNGMEKKLVEYHLNIYPEIDDGWFEASLGESVLRNHC